MNRIISHLPTSPQNRTQGHPALRAERKLRLDVESMLRDMAFVLKMTQRVKAEILNENSASEALAV
jgi:hypothetical protein